MLSRRLLLALLAAAVSPAAITSVHVIERTDMLEGRSFGAAGPYELVIAKVNFAIDPKLPVNQIISDIALAPLNRDGQVEFSSDLYMLKPRDSAKGNGTVLLEISNRGTRGALSMFNFASSTALGDYFLLERGYTIAWLGWQWDVPERTELLRLYAPVAKTITGLVRAEFITDARATEFSLADRGHVAYPVADLAEKSLRLTVRDHANSQRTVIPREQWKLADATHVAMAAGFEPGKIYEIAYTAKDPVLVGLGPAAVRDFVSFLKYGGVETLLADQRAFIKRAIGFGTSQSGRFLRTFLYYGFNRDEKNHRVFDGVWAHVAGAGRGSFNHRFAQPSRDGHSLLNTMYPTDIFPYTDLDETDPETGLTDGLLDRASKAGVAPKIFYTNGSYEYYGRAASLIHTTLDGREDAPLAPDTRIYFLAGTQHGPGAFPPRQSGTQNLSNTNDYRYMMRALLVAMERWLKDGTPPPESRYPLIAKNQLVPLNLLGFPKIPGVHPPVRKLEAYRLDFGEQFRTAGLDTVEPPKVGKPFTTLVPAVNADGNEISGVRMPALRVPLASNTGWNLRDPKIGAPDELYSMVGSWLPFAVNSTERENRHDPRTSVEERYASKIDYLEKISAAAQELIREGFLLDADFSKVRDRAASEWDYVTAPPH